MNEALDKLTERKRRFVLAFAEHGFARQAAVDAGYAPKHADIQAAKLMKDEGVAAAIAALRDATVSEKVATITELREFWTQGMRDANAEMKMRLKASELLGKSMGAFLERVEHSGKVESAVTVYLPANGR